MMYLRSFLFFFLLVVFAGPLRGQSAALRALEPDSSADLHERYQRMKKGSETFQDYKVIKEHILEGFWKIVSDSLVAQRESRHQWSRQRAIFGQRLDSLRQEVATQQAAVEEAHFDSTHITVLGIPFHKAAFLTLIAALLGGCLFAMVTLAGALRLQRQGHREVQEAHDALTTEFEAYKRKSMEKQTRLARELQDERNRVFERQKN